MLSKVSGRTISAVDAATACVESKGRRHRGLATVDVPRLCELTGLTAAELRAKVRHAADAALPVLRAASAARRRPPGRRPPSACPRACLPLRGQPAPTSGP